jgi:hypothetical protein
LGREVKAECGPTEVVVADYFEDVTANEKCCQNACKNAGGECGPNICDPGKALPKGNKGCTEGNVCCKA